MSSVMELCSSAMRGCIAAAPGKRMCVADLANIEGRKAAWLGHEEWKLQAFRDYDTIIGYDSKGKPERLGPDLYKVAYARSFGVDVKTVDKDQRQLGKVQELALQFASGVGGFVTMAMGYNMDLEEIARAVLRARESLPAHIVEGAEAWWEMCVKEDRTLGLSHNAFVACDILKRSWREAHPGISSYWKELQDQLAAAIQNPGVTFKARRIKIRRDGNWVRLQTPSGRHLCYFNPEVTEDGQITYHGVNPYTRKWERIKTYGGKIFENCIAQGTPVLTNRGWIAIESVLPSDLIWDGEEWVTHDGCVYKGKQVVLPTYGVLMTPDHLVLTVEGWKDASSCEGLDRASCGLPDGYTVSGIGRQEIDMGSRVRVRQDDLDAGNRAGEAEEPGDNFLLRLHEESHHIEARPFTRHERSSCLWSMEGNEQSMPPSDTPCVEKLWGAWNQSMRRMGRRLRSFLAGHGSHLFIRSNSRTHQQHGPLSSWQLPVGELQSSGKQSAQQPSNTYPSRTSNIVPGAPSIQRMPFYFGLATETGLADRKSTRPVYDLVNCGSRNRFVVRGEGGQLVIVHNCTQFGARDVLAHNLPAIEAAGYAVTMLVHDEVIAEADDLDQYSGEHLAELMSVVPDWAEGLPLAAEGFTAYRYRK